MNYTIEAMQPLDWNQAAQIYFEGIQMGNATFQNEVPTWEDWDKDHLKECRFVAKKNDEILGWVALSPTSKRPVFKGVAEDSIYIKKANWGQGIGSELMKRLILESEEKGFWTIEAKIFPENHESIALHEKFGFKSVGKRINIGQMADGRWRDIVLLERRSKIIG